MLRHSDALTYPIDDGSIAKEANAVIFPGALIKSVVTMLLVVVVAGCSGIDQPQGSADRSFSPSNERATADDCLLIDTVVSDLFEFGEFGDGVPGGRNLVMSNMTLGGGISKDQIPIDIEPHSVSTNLIDALDARNAKGVLLTGFKPHNPKIVLTRHEYSEIDYYRLYPDAKAWLSFWLPAYSRDGQTAIVRFQFGPTPHGASSTYSFRKKDGKWTIEWRKIAYYA